MKNKHKEAIKNYQCSGCVDGPGLGCFKSYMYGVGCGAHVAGTTIIPAGRIMLGMPIGFNRVGPHRDMPLVIFDGPSEEEGGWGYGQYGYGVFNVPAWKHLDEDGNTLVRGVSPRTNVPFLHVLIGNHMDKIDCMKITAMQVEGMD